MKSTITPNQINKAINDGDAWSSIFKKFIAFGGDINQWQVKDQEYMCDALTYTEDELELEYIDYGRFTSLRAIELMALRLRMRDIRRKLECELWP